MLKRPRHLKEGRSGATIIRWCVGTSSIALVVVVGIDLFLEGSIVDVLDILRQAR